MFDWDRFKKGKIKVILRTEQLAKDFYKECKKRRIDWSRCDYAIWNEGGIVYKYCTISNSLVWNGIIDDGQESVEWKGVNCMKELTFKEVITNIKEGEVWESEVKIIEYKYGRIVIKNIVHSVSDTFIFSDSVKYKLKRKEYTFEEAFNAYKEGKEIESCFSGEKFRIYSWEEIFNVKEIAEKWYIND